MKNKTTAGNFNSFITMLLGGLWHGASWNFVIWGALNGVGMIVYKVWSKMNWHIKMLLMTILVGGLKLAQVLIQQPVWNVFWVWGGIVWVGTVVRYAYYLIMEKGASETTYRPKIITMLSATIGSCWAILQTFVFITFTRLFFRSGSNLDPATASQEAWETAKNMVNQIGGAWNSSIIPAFLGEYRYVVILFVAGMLIHWLPSKLKRWYRLHFASLPIWAIILLVVATVVFVYQFVTADMQAFIYFQF